MIRDERGVVLLLSFMVMAALVVVTASFLSMLSYQSRSAGHDVNSDKALWIAEGGLEQVIYQLKTDSDYRDSPTAVTGNLGDGSYAASASKNGNTYSITSTGTVDQLDRTITLSVIAGDGTPEAFLYTLSADKEINFENSDGTVTGNISTGKQLESEGGMTINGTVTENSSVEFPTADFSSYADIADHVVNGTKTFSDGQTYSGIWYVTKEVSIESNVTINGTIVSLKDVDLAGSENIVIAPGTGYPAIVSDKGIDGEGLTSSTISGLIYAAKEIKFSESEDVSINGLLVSGKEIVVENADNFTITYDSGILTNIPPYFSEGEAESGTITFQKDWNEI